MTALFVGDGGLGADKSSGEEGIDGEKLDGFVEDGIGECTDSELGTDKGRQLAETETRGGVGGVEEACAVEKVGVGVSRGGVADVNGPCSGQSAQSQHGGEDCIWMVANQSRDVTWTTAQRGVEQLDMEVERGEHEKEMDASC